MTYEHEADSLFLGSYLSLRRVQ